MPIMFDDPLVPSPKPGGGSGSCSSTGGGGFTPPQCPITTSQTVCEPKTVTSCSCVNGGPKNPISPVGWETIEVGEDGQGGFSGGYPAGGATLNPTTQTVTLGGGPSSWSPPSFSYTGYLQLRLNCSDGSYHVLDSWTTRNGGPSRNLISQTMNPCGASSLPPPDLGNKNTQAECNQAAAANSDYNISWSCVDIVTEDCTTITDTNYVDANPIVKAGALAGLLGIFGWPSPPPPPTMIDLTKLTPDELKKFIEAALQTQKNKSTNLPWLKDVLDYNRAKDLVKEYRTVTVNGKTTVEVIFKNPKNLTAGDKVLALTIRNIVKQVQDVINSGKTVSSDSSVGRRFLQLLKEGGKISAQTLARLGPCLSRIKPLIAFLGVLAASEAEAAVTALTDPSFGSAGLGNSDITWTCSPGDGEGDGAGGDSGSGAGPEGDSGIGPIKGSNNDGQLNSTDGAFLQDGSFQDHNSSISSPVPKPNSDNPSRSNFLRGNISTNVNMRAMSNINAPTDLRNNLTLNSNYGMPIKNFPVLKVSKAPPTPRDIIAIDDGKFIPGQVNYPF